MVARVVKLGFIGLRSARIENMKAHYADVIGLPVLEEAGRDGAFFSCGSEPHAIQLYPSADGSGLQHVGFRVERGTPLSDVSKVLLSAGVKSKRCSDPFPGIEEALAITDVDGYELYLYQDSSAPAVSYGSGGVMPNKLGHVALFVGDAQRASEFYTDALGFRWSDWCEDLFVFMRCNCDHHSLNLTKHGRRGLFHFAFEVRDFAHIGQSCDLLASRGIPIIWGPGRHGMGHNLFAYHRDPDGNIVEFMADMDRMADEGIGYFDPKPFHEDVPQRPKVWKRDPASANIWGTLPPGDFIE